MSPLGVGTGSDTGCSAAWSCTPRRCDSSTAFQASRRALRLPSSVDAWRLVLWRIFSSTRLASAAAPRKATATKSALIPALFYHLCARVCAMCRVVCACVCVRWCRVVCRYKYYPMEDVGRISRQNCFLIWG